MEKTYKLNIDPRILELLGPSLYTNIYYILAELIANAYDADASNVWIYADPDSITIEDDGKGMSYKNGEIDQYLNVAAITRVSEKDTYTKKGRKKMGRKGVGKLAALSVSENIEIKTIVNNEKSGFILTRHPKADNQLIAINDDNISFRKISTHGTAVVMKEPHYKLHNTIGAIERNLLRIFPVVDNSFAIHFIRDNAEHTLRRSPKETAEDLCALITLGNEFSAFSEAFKNDYPNYTLCKNKAEKLIKVSIRPNNEKHFKDYQMAITGWIGAYKTTTNRKKEFSDFPDNYISLYANGKMGEFNILPKVSQNKLNEVYVVGQLHIDLFEASELPDMALSNRQGYKSDDIRYQEVVKYVRNDLLPEILTMRTEYTQAKRENAETKKLSKQKEAEENFKKDVNAFKKMTTEEAGQKLLELFPASDISRIQTILSKTIEKHSEKLKIKPALDMAKRKLLISQTYHNKNVSDIIYEMLLYNNVPPRDIIYTNSDDAAARIPIGENGQYAVYDYLRDFFVDSCSTQKIFVIFVTSEEMEKSWGTVIEVGAAWITKSQHKLFNINPYRPQDPLDTRTPWCALTVDDAGVVYMNTVNQDIFCDYINFICSFLGYQPKTKEQNKNKLNKLGIVH